MFITSPALHFENDVDGIKTCNRNVSEGDNLKLCGCHRATHAY